MRWRIRAAGVSFDFWGPKMELPLAEDKQKKRDALNAEMEVYKEELASLDKEAKRKYKEQLSKNWKSQKRRNLIGKRASRYQVIFGWRGKFESLRIIACWRRGKRQVDIPN